MADYMFPANPPPMPPEFMDADSQAALKVMLFISK